MAREFRPEPGIRSRTISMTNRRIIIGDVHGHYDGLMKLFEAFAPNPRDEVYFLGDLIDRGPKSAQVVDFVRNHAYNCILGNHEQMLLNAFSLGGIVGTALESWLYSGGNTTLDCYSDLDDLIDHVNWLRRLPPYLDLGDLWLVHAGVNPKLPVEEQTPEDLCWIREEFHSIAEPYFADKLIIVGHTMTFTLPSIQPGTLAQGQGWLGIDTGVYHLKSGWLTGLDITNQQVYQVNVFQNDMRTLPLPEVVRPVDPEQILLRRRFLRA